MTKLDMAILNGTAVISGVGTVRADIGIRDGAITTIADRIASESAEEVVDAAGQLVLPGAVDAHFHIGIFRPISDDAQSETRSALVGGTTSVISYFRTGSHYLNRSGPYAEIFPEVLSAVEGNAFTDYGFHVAIMTSAQLDEIPWLVEAGVGSFKYYMFYKGMNLSSSSTVAADYTMSDVYDLGHLYRYMQGVRAAADRYGSAGRISLSLHCEQSEILRTTIEEAKQLGLEGLEAYHRGRPPFQERLAIAEATLLADVTGCPVNLLHLSSEEALAGAEKARADYPSLDILLETTLHHLALTYDRAGGIESGKVNPPIRTAADVEALWRGVTSGAINQVVSDHACCLVEQKQGGTWEAQPGFGGSSLIYPVMVSEGYHRRGVPLERLVDLVAGAPARNFGLAPQKGAIAIGADADLVVLDPELEAEVTTERLLSAQDHTPFAGVSLRGWPTRTIRGGRVVFRDGEVVGEPDGRFLKRPIGLHVPEGVPA